MKVYPMPLPAFLRLYIGFALLGSVALWMVAGSSMLLSTRRVVPRPHITNIRPVKSGIASFEDGSPLASSVDSRTRSVAAASEVGRLRIVRSEPGLVSHMSKWLESRAGSFAASAANLCGVDPVRYSRLIQLESGGRHYAADGSVLKSRSNAYGMAQVKHIAALDLAGAGKPLDIMDPWENALAGACYWRKQYDRRKDWHAATLDYRLGPYRVGATRSAMDYADAIMGAN